MTGEKPEGGKGQAEAPGSAVGRASRARPAQRTKAGRRAQSRSEHLPCLILALARGRCVPADKEWTSPPSRQGHWGPAATGGRTKTAEPRGSGENLAPPPLAGLGLPSRAPPLAFLGPRLSGPASCFEGPASCRPLAVLWPQARLLPTSGTRRPSWATRSRPPNLRARRGGPGARLGPGWPPQLLSGGGVLWRKGRAAVASFLRTSVGWLPGHPELGKSRDQRVAAIARAYLNRLVDSARAQAARAGATSFIVPAQSEGAPAA